MIQYPAGTLRGPFKPWFLLRGLRLSLLWFCGFWSPLVFAHESSLSFLTLVVASDQVRGRWEIPLANLDLAFGLDADADHAISLDELQPRFEEIRNRALEQLRLRLDGVPGSIVVTNPSAVVLELADGSGMLLDFVVTNTPARRTLEVEYNFLIDQPHFEQAFVQVECRGVSQAAIFSSRRTVHLFNLEGRKAIRELIEFTRHGVWHILIGYDHILFLLALLLPAVLRLEDGRWRPVARFGEAFWNVFKVVTAFTVAHSVTLSLAVLGVVRLPTRWVEIAIALSVAVAALNNLQPRFRGPTWMIAFCFGLLHGFGFANVLSELGLPQQHMAVALLGFNLGVEAGQLAIVAGFLPVAYALRRSRHYRPWILQAGSGLIVVLALVWCLERALGG